MAARQSPSPLLWVGCRAGRSSLLGHPSAPPHVLTPHPPSCRAKCYASRGVLHGRVVRLKQGVAGRLLRIGRVRSPDRTPSSGPIILIDNYLEAARIDLSQKAAPLFLAADRWGLGLLDRAMTAHGVRRMLKRRLKEAGLPEIITPHSFRVMVVTDLLGQNVPMEDVQYLAGHSNPQTTQIYDRRRRRVTRNIVERISV